MWHDDTFSPSVCVCGGGGGRVGGNLKKGLSNIGGSEVKIKVW